MVDVKRSSNKRVLYRVTTSPVSAVDSTVSECMWLCDTWFTTLTGSEQLAVEDGLLVQC